ncbi:hypothetical protein LOZ80_25980 [Paenibacillus sp. HWE-109]|uniref:portal protein n=1 Tax=Paenibacillus sp. HWE-109 TaxID=1306526 RepID=UPI001EDC94F6|nr:hypothetical protein [Paenibacillus sp. HWE-109]UKS25030.1 hypothetical protein LOZ80_25980 [Paenibacillus sp. HWE-109]
MMQEGSKVQKNYTYGLAYIKRMGFLDLWPEYERFKAGIQWPPVTKRTENLPRPVFNIIRYIENHKVSTVMNENVKMLFSPEEMAGDGPESEQQETIETEAADKFTRYSDTAWEKIKQDELNEEALESASNLGTGIWHYYWDSDITGGKELPYEGDMCGETIDPLNIFFGNPQERRVQKQPYILISFRDEVDSVKEQAIANKVPQHLVDLIKPDSDTNNEGYDRAKVELTDSTKTTVLTKYWREKGMIYFTKVCGSIIVKPKTPTNMKLYPIVVMQWERRKKSIFGVGDTEGIIPNQKAINFLMAMQLLSVQLTGWPKLVYKDGAIDPNKVTNTPGEMIADKTPPGQGDGVKYLTPGSSTNLAMGLVDSFMEYTKSLSSAQDASTGDVGKGQLNASAIMLLQKAAGVPIESIKKRFYRAIEDIGRIWEEFWKVKYNTTRKVTLKNDDGKEYPAEFNGSNYKDVDMNLKIDIGPSSQYSEELMMSSLDKLFDGQYISLEDYLEFAPQNVIPFKDRLLKKIEKQKEAQNMQIVMQMPPEQQQMYMNSPPEVQQQMIQQFTQQQQQAQASAQIQDPQEQFKQDMALKEVDNQHDMKKAELQSQTDLQKEAMKQTASAGQR